MKTSKIVLVGGGHAHALLLQAWQPEKYPQLELIVIEPHEHVPYTGMLPGFVAGHYVADDLYIPIKVVTKRAGGMFVSDKATHIDPYQQIVYTTDGEYQYDILSADVGIHTNVPDLPRFRDHAVGVKPLGAFATRWQQLCDDANTSKPQHIVVLGGGVAGVEVALAMRHRLAQLQIDASVTIIERGALLQKASSSTQRYIRKQLQQHNIAVREGETVTEILSDAVVLGSESLPATFVLGATGARPYNWLAQTSLPTTDGYIDIDETLRSPQYPNVFAVGDCAHFVSQPLVKAGVYAVRQAPVLQTNIQALVSDKPLQTFTPQSDYLKLISLGGKRAAADKWGMCLRGRLLWQLKDYIDQTFMKKLRR